MAGYFDLVINYYAALKILPLSAATLASAGYQVAFSRQRRHGLCRKNLRDGPKDEINQVGSGDDKLSTISVIEALLVRDNLTFVQF